MSTITNPRPKRVGQEFDRNHYNADISSTKKPRFDTRNPAALVPDALEEDEVLDADEIGKRGQQTKRNAVNIDGYGSDSSNEGFDARANSKAQRAGSKDEDENDMFADLQNEPTEIASEDGSDGTKKKKKKVKFLGVDDIEGQVQHSKSGGHVKADFVQQQEDSQGIDNEVESSSDSEIADEDRAEVGSDLDEELGAGSKKKHAPKLDAFNLNAETQDGGFDEHGNFVRKAQDPDAVYDTWMDGLSKKDLKKAREAQAQRELEQREKRLQDDSVTTGDLLKTVIPLLDKGETILEALARLGRIGKKKPKWQSKVKNKRSHEMDLDSEERKPDSMEEKQREAVEAITEAADILMSRNNLEIYDTDRELLIRIYRRETGEQWAEDTAGGQATQPTEWEYRWADARDGGDAHGPYDTATMLAWSDAGYFGEGVEFRSAGDESASWERTAGFLA
ncbi:hypothetical protein MMC10_000083 [Thelotrema lepadinum]|nr:hypothetical protein [Thelotrema lepadinum]